MFVWNLINEAKRIYVVARLGDVWAFYVIVGNSGMNWLSEGKFEIKAQGFWPVCYLPFYHVDQIRQCIYSYHTNESVLPSQHVNMHYPPPFSQLGGTNWVKNLAQEFNIMGWS